MPIVRTLLIAATAAASAVAADGAAAAPAAASATAPAMNVVQEASYLIGRQMGQAVKMHQLDRALVLQAILDEVEGRPALVPVERTQEVFQAFEQAQGERRKAGNQDVLAKAAAKAGSKTTPGGVVCESLKAGTGAQAAKGATVTVHYTGMLTDGTVFDSSVARNEPAKFPLNDGQLIRGWLEAIPLMKIGDKWRITIPSDLAYGPQGRPPTIPGDSVLVFEVELLGVDAPAGAAPAPAPAPAPR